MYNLILDLSGSNNIIMFLITLLLLVLKMSFGAKNVLRDTHCGVLRIRLVLLLLLFF